MAIGNWYEAGIVMHDGFGEAKRDRLIEVALPSMQCRDGTNFIDVMNSVCLIFLLDGNGVVRVLARMGWLFLTVSASCRALSHRTGCSSSFLFPPMSRFHVSQEQVFRRNGNQRISAPVNPGKSRILSARPRGIIGGQLANDAIVERRFVGDSRGY